MLFVLALLLSLELGVVATVMAVVEPGDCWVARPPPLPVLMLACVLRGS